MRGFGRIDNLKKEMEAIFKKYNLKISESEV